MKQLSTLFEDLSYGQLSNLALSNEGSGTILEESRPKLILYLNDALTNLYSRFTLRTKEVLIKQYKHITNYRLSMKYAMSQHEPEAEGYPYIMDLMGEPFVEDVIKILAVRNSTGYKYPLNDVERPDSVFTPQYNLIQVPYPIEGMAMSVIYQAKHREMKLEELTEDEPEGFEIPDVLYGALKSYIAYSVFSHMNTQESSAKAQEHLALYEATCSSVEDKDLVSTSISTTEGKFEIRGWK